MAMTKCNHKEFEFSSSTGRKITTSFSGGDVSSDGGLPLIREIDRRLNFTERASKCLQDNRQQSKVKHDTKSLLRERLYGICAGWEDLNDFDYLRSDSLYKAMVGKTDDLASPPTLCRFENRQGREAALELNRLMVDCWMESYTQPPNQIILDFDATDNPIHGNQEGKFFHGYYDHHCFLPLYVFCGGQLLCAYLRQSNIDGAKHSGAILKLLVQYVRQKWPRTKIIYRADSGFCRNNTLSWCERNNVNYVIGIARNKRLEALGSELQEKAEKLFEQENEAQKLFGELQYSANSWDKERRIIHKAEHLSKGANPRFIITNMNTPAQELYEEVYCARGDMENRIKEQIMLFSTRTSAHYWWTNQWRLLLSGLAYTLMEALRRICLKGTSLEKAQCSTLCVKLIKIGAVIVCNTRRVRIHLSESYPLKSVFEKAFKRLLLT